MKETRKVIRVPTEKESKRQYQKDGNKFKVTSTILKCVNYIFFDISSRQYLLKEELKRLVTNIDIEICRHDEIHNEDIQIGEALAFFIKGDLATGHGSLSKVMNDHSRTLGDVYSALFSKDDQPVNRLDEFGAFGMNMLFIDYLCLHPAYRGVGLGRPILQGIVEEISCGAEVAIIEPLPVRFEDEKKNAELQLPFLADEEYESAVRKLRDYWKMLGFMPIEGNDRFLVQPLSIMHPAVVELLNEIPKSE